MALDTYAQFSYTLQDELGTKATVMVPAYVDGALVDAADLQAQWTSLGTDIDGFTSAQIIGGSVTVVVLPDGAWKDAPAGGSRVEQTANFNFNNNTTKYKYGINVPSLADSAISGGQINLADTDVAAFVAKIIAGFTNGSFTNLELRDLVSLADAFISFRKHRRQVDRATYEVP